MSDLTDTTIRVLLVAAHVGLAAAVTGHVLLHKRDTASASAWIGLAWLSPLIGTVLYLLLGINRVRRRALMVRGSANRAPSLTSTDADAGSAVLAPLRIAGTRITERPLQPGNSIAVLRSGDEAYPRMLAAIDAATSSVTLSSYIFRPDAAGVPFIEALVRAHRRGAAVRVLIDGFGGGYLLSGAYRRLRAAGVPAGRHMHSPLPWRMPFLNLRSHTKSLVCDERVAFLGGLNIGAENVQGAHPAQAVVDTHFLVEGPVIAQLVDAFAVDWLFSTGEATVLPTPGAPSGRRGNSTARVVTSGPDQDVGKLESLILEAVSCARQSVRIMTPYFLPEESVVMTLTLAALRGVDVDLYLPARSNHPMIDWAARRQIAPLIAAGVKVWTHPTPFDHSKLMTVDSEWCLIGSANWDVRSLRLNFELNMEVYDTDLAAFLNEFMRQREQTALTTASLRRRPLALRLRDSAARLMLPYL